MRRAELDRRRRRSRDGVLLLAPPNREEVGGIIGRQVDVAAYLPPPGPGTARPNRPGVSYDPAAEQTHRPHRAAAPDPNTRPTFQPMTRVDAARLPRQIPPRRQEESYAAGLVKIVRRARHAYAPLLRALPGLLEHAEVARQDADASGKLRSLIASAVAATRKAIQQPEVDALARKMARQVSSYHKDQLGRQVRAALGADPVFRDRGLAARVDHFAHENAARITTIPERLHGEVAGLVTRAVSAGRRNVASGEHAANLAREIEDRFDVSERHARLIARDQIGKFYAGLNHARQREMGVRRFTWRTTGDEAVRGTPGGKYPDADPSHYELDDKVFDYDDPPPAGPDGEPALPGEAIQCRCWAEPVWDLDDESESDDDDGSDEEDEADED